MDTDPRTERGPYAAEPTSVDLHEPAPASLPLSPSALSRRARMIDDPWAPYLDATGACRGCGGRNGHGGTCPHLLTERGVDLLAPPIPGPALGTTVANADGDLGLVVGQPFGSVNTQVAVEWEWATALADVDELHTEYGECDHGRGAGSCDAPTAPSHTRCGRHGGADPLEVSRG